MKNLLIYSDLRLLACNAVWLVSRLGNSITPMKKLLILFGLSFDALSRFDGGEGEGEPWSVYAGK